MAIIDAIPCKWRETLKTISYVDNSNEIQLKLLGVRIPISKDILILSLES